MCTPSITTIPAPAAATSSASLSVMDGTSRASTPEASTPTLMTLDNDLSETESSLMSDDDLSKPLKEVKKPGSSSTFFRRRLGGGWFWFGLLLDLPLLTVLLTTASLVWLEHVHRAYLFPQLLNLEWNSRRSDAEITYYDRQCDKNDLTTNSSADLFLDASVSPQDAALHQRTHGFTVIQNVISDETMTKLRDLIYYKNYHEESMYVIEGKHRFSIMLGTEDKIVRDALEEIATHRQFKETLEEIMGPDPAMIEMTAISSSAGAVAQWWHSDVDDSASSTNYARTFGPSYSVFIQLQNTTKAMGATAICPGSHYCTDGPISAFCEEAGLHGVNEHGVSKGDALIMNMNSYHRGGAHVDYGGLDRIMLILTFSPKPSKRAETRQMSQGITFQLRWDMWGHTLNDLARANTVMVQPWVTLKSLGLYKLPGTSWGVDYITSSSQRIVSIDNGFRRYDLVDGLIAKGGFPFLPSFLLATIAKQESWYEFLSRTLELCLTFMKDVSLKVLGFYVASILLLCIPVRRRLPFLRRASIRMTVVLSTVALLFCLAKSNVDHSGWGKDSAAKRKFTSVAKHEKLALDRSCLEQVQRRGQPKGKFLFCNTVSERRYPSTFPNQKDVLIETRLGTEKLALFNGWIDGHPGNAMFRNLIESETRTASQFEEYPIHWKDAMAKNIVDAILANQGRFLFQHADGVWVRLSADDALSYTKQELWLQGHAEERQSSVWMRYLQTDLAYSQHRDSALAFDHSRRFIQDLEGKMLEPMHAAIGTSSSTTKSSAPGRSPVFHRPPLPSLSPTVINAQRPLRLSDLSPSPVEPYPGAWIEEGSIVEAQVATDEEGGWYGGRVFRVNAHGSYAISFGDETVEAVTMHKIRNVQKFTVGESVEALIENGEYQACEVTSLPDANGLVNLKIVESGKVVEGFSPIYLSRVGGYTPVKPDRNSPVYGLVVGATVEVLNADEGVWYTGTISNVNTESDAEYTIDFVDETTSVVSDPRTIRPLSDYIPGEILKVYVEAEDDYTEVKYVSKLSYGTFKGEQVSTGYSVEGFQSIHVGRTGRFAE